MKRGGTEGEAGQKKEVDNKETTRQKKKAKL